MARLLAVLGIKEGLHKVPGNAGSNCTTTHAEDVHMIVFDSLLRGEMVMDQAGMNSLDLIGTDGSSNTAAADRNTALHLSGNDRMGQRNNVVGIVIVMAKLMGPEVYNLMTGSLKLGYQLFLEFEATVICCKSYAHEKTLVSPSPKARGKPLIR
jgi:hypothetical protein